MRNFLATYFLILCFAIPAVGSPTLVVKFPEKGRYLYWFEYKDVNGGNVITAPIHTAGENAEVNLSTVTVGGRILSGVLKVYDPKSGNVAAKKLQNLTGKKELLLKPADFDLVRTVRIILKPAEGRPDERVESAVVSITDANADEFKVLVDPTSQGVAEFHDIAAGQEKVTVLYGGEKMTIDMQIPTERDDAIFTRSIAVSGDVRTVKAASEEEGAASRKESPTDDQGRQGGIISYLAGLAFVLLVLYVIYVVLKSRGVTLKQSLKKIGVDLPQDEAPVVPQTGVPSPEPAVDPNVCQFCGQRKDPATGRCACTIDASPAPQAGNPRLVCLQGVYAGRVFDLTADSITIGRDQSNMIPLTEDAAVSRMHAQITKSSGAVTITDLGSSNGTFVNGMRITSPHPLASGDEIQFGGSKFKFEA